MIRPVSMASWGQTPDWRGSIKNGVKRTRRCHIDNSFKQFCFKGKKWVVAWQTCSFEIFVVAVFKSLTPFLNRKNYSLLVCDGNGLVARKDCWCRKERGESLGPSPRVGRGNTDQNKGLALDRIMILFIHKNSCQPRCIRTDAGRGSQLSWFVWDWGVSPVMSFSVPKLAQPRVNGNRLVTPERGKFMVWVL